MSASTGNAGQALADIRKRVSQHISVPVSDAEALKLCFTCATVECDALLDLSHARLVQTEANAHRRALALTPCEFATLLDDASMTSQRLFNLTNALAEQERDAERQEHNASIEAALRLTLGEKTQRALWESSPRVRACVALAVLREEDHVECLHHALGVPCGGRDARGHGDGPRVVLGVAASRPPAPSSSRAARADSNLAWAHHGIAWMRFQRGDISPALAHFDDPTQDAIFYRVRLRTRI